MTDLNYNRKIVETRYCILYNVAVLDRKVPCAVYILYAKKETLYKFYVNFSKPMHVPSEMLLLYCLGALGVVSIFVKIFTAK